MSLPPREVIVPTVAVRGGAFIFVSGLTASDRGTTSATSPIRDASSASTLRAVSISSWARDAPISRGSSQLVPMSQFDTPMFANAARKTAERAAGEQNQTQPTLQPQPESQEARVLPPADEGFRRPPAETPRLGSGRYGYVSFIGVE